MYVGDEVISSTGSWYAVAYLLSELYPTMRIILLLMMRKMSHIGSGRRKLVMSWLGNVQHLNIITTIFSPSTYNDIL